MGTSLKFWAPGKCLTRLLGLSSSGLETLDPKMGSCRSVPGPWGPFLMCPWLTTALSSPYEVAAGLDTFLSFRERGHEVLLWVLSEVRSPLVHWYFTVEQLPSASYWG